jgi:hypothetical protein
MISSIPVYFSFIIALTHPGLDVQQPTRTLPNTAINKRATFHTPQARLLDEPSIEAAPSKQVLPCRAYVPLRIPRGCHRTMLQRALEPESADGLLDRMLHDSSPRREQSARLSIENLNSRGR